MKVGIDRKFLRSSMMYKYEIIIYLSEEAFSAEVPELPGCMADGKTYEEALTNSKIAIDEWIETAKEIGRKILSPKVKLAFA